MSEPTDLNDFDAMIRIVGAVADLTDKDKLSVLAMAWLAVAANVRNEAGTADGFIAERADQLRVLARMADVVERAELDLEGDRLLEDGNLEGWRRYVTRLGYRDRQ